MKFSTVDSRPITIGLYAGGNWLNWAKSTPQLPIWEQPFFASDHLHPCVCDIAMPQIQQLTVPDQYMDAADCLITFTSGIPLCADAIASNAYFGAFPGVICLKP